MKGWILRWLLSGLALILTAALVTGIDIKTFTAALFAALILGIVNAVIRPIILLLTLPINILSLGLFTIVINGFMLQITSSAVNGFEISGFWAATLGAILLSIISGALSMLITDN